MRISRILHAGYVFECDGTTIAFDPLFENPFSINCHAFPSVDFDLEAIRELRWDAVFISHYHDDHFSIDSLRFLRRETPIYLFCAHPRFFDLLRGLGFTRVTSLVLDDVVDIGTFRVTTRRALDADVDSIFQIEAGRRKVLNVVDSWIDPPTMDLLESQGPWDVVLWPFQTMRELEIISPSRAEPASGELPREWTDQLPRLRPRVVVPSSCQFRFEEWSWSNRAFFPISYAGFRAQVERMLPETRVLRLNPGETMNVEAREIDIVDRLSWIHRRGDQEVDYEYVPETEAPPVAEIASRFAPLSKDKLERVGSYLDDELLHRYQELDDRDAPYFHTERVWKVVVHDRDAQPLERYYKIRRDKIARAEPGEFQWLTEIPAARLIGALDRGETLTSLHIRVNDHRFSSLTERDLADTDALEDPLIRTLSLSGIDAFQVGRYFAVISSG